LRSLLLLAPALCILGLSSSSGVAQPSSPVASPASAASDWQRVERVPLHTKVHVDADKKGRTCLLDSVNDQSLTCTSGHTGRTFSRAEIKSVKLTRYGWSTLGGLAIGLGVGGAIAATGPSDSIARGAAGGLCIVAGAVVGGMTDMFRGPVVYRRPGS
jgi:hypothetical protein